MLIQSEFVADTGAKMVIIIDMVSEGREPFVVGTKPSVHKLDISIGLLDSCNLHFMNDLFIISREKHHYLLTQFQQIFQLLSYYSNYHFQMHSKFLSISI